MKRTQKVSGAGSLKLFWWFQRVVQFFILTSRKYFVSFCLEPYTGIFSEACSPTWSVSAWRQYKKWRPWGAIFITCHSDARPTIPHFMNKFQGALQPRNELEEQHLVLPVNPASIPPRAWHYQPGPHWTNYVQEEFPVNWNEFKIWEEYQQAGKSLKMSHFTMKGLLFKNHLIFQLRALKSPQKFQTSNSANFLGSRPISGFKLKSNNEIWTFWSINVLQMIQLLMLRHFLWIFTVGVFF